MDSLWTHFDLTHPKAQEIARYLADKGEASPKEIIKYTTIGKSTTYLILKSLMKNRIIEREKKSHKNVTYSLTQKGRVEYETTIERSAFRGSIISKTISAAQEKGSPEVKYQIATSISREDWRENTIAHSLLTQCVLNACTDTLASVYTFTNYPIPILGEIDSAARGKFLDLMLNSQFGLSVVVDLKPVRGKRGPLPTFGDDFSRTTDLIEKPTLSAEEQKQLMTPFVLAVLSRYQHRGFLLTSLHIARLVLHLLRSCALQPLENIDIATFESIVQSILEEKVNHGEVGALKGYFRITQDMHDFENLTHLPMDEVQFQRCPEKILDETAVEDSIKKSREFQRDLLGREQFRRDLISAINEILAKNLAGIVNERGILSRDELLAQVTPVFDHWGYSQVIGQIESYLAKAYSSETHTRIISLLSSGKVPVFHITDNNEIIVSEGKREDSELLYLTSLYKAFS